MVHFKVNKENDRKALCEVVLSAKENMGLQKENTLTQGCLFHSLIYSALYIFNLHALTNLPMDNKAAAIIQRRAQAVSPQARILK